MPLTRPSPQFLRSLGGRKGAAVAGATSDRYLPLLLMLQPHQLAMVTIDGGFGFGVGGVLVFFRV